jgi:hypothetical protein
VKGVDPRGWDLHGLLAAFESTLRAGSKDEAAWRRTHSQLYAEPREMRRARADAQRKRTQEGRQTGAQPPTAGGMDLAAVESLLAGMAATEAQFE